MLTYGDTCATCLLSPPRAQALKATLYIGAEHGGGAKVSIILSSHRTLVYICRKMIIMHTFSLLHIR